MKTSLRLLLTGLALTALAARGLAHSDELKPEHVDPLVPAYLTVQQALAGDDLGAAQSAAQNLAAQAKAAGHLEDLAAYAAKLADDGDLKAARADFQDLTVEFATLVEHVGTTGDQTLYLAHCPMAFGGKGGDWVQADRTISNPYYGAMMLRCGGIKKQLAGTGNNAKPAAMKHGQDHSSIAPANPSARMDAAALAAVHANVPQYFARTGQAAPAKPKSACGMACCGGTD